MAYRVGIIPAAGKARRFGGVMKELLPTRTGASFLSEAVSRLSFCDDVVIITNKEKISEHALEIGCGVYYVIQHGLEDIWSAIRTGIDFQADYYFFTMPDTIMDKGFTEWREADFSMGLFWTDKPERFGMYRDGRIINKQPGSPGRAWGLLAWSKKVADYWKKSKVCDYTEAISMAIHDFDVQTFDIGNYFDNASIEDYIRYMRGEA